MRRSKKLMKELHENLWLSWLAGDPKREKRSFPRWKENGGDLHSDTDCFACDYTKREGLTSCCRCPLDFPGREDIGSPESEIYCLGGLYDKWEASTGKARVAWAKIIGLLPIYKEE